ncbi:MAG: S53 family peptidase [Streptosporangiaceae bacterium]|nr:S53 family peptidase [Streptosporangiaceae bacterium]
MGALVAAVLIANVATRAATPKTSSTENASFPAPLSTAKCWSQFKVRCYTPAQFQAAYNLTALYSGEATGRPLTGAGQTIVIAEAYGSPTIRNDLRVFDQKFKLPNPSLTVDQFGKVPPFNPNDPLMVGEAQEATLTIEYAHAIAPGASIVLAETAVNTPMVGPAGISQLMTAEKSLIDKGIGDVFLQTLTDAEASFPGVSSGNYSSLLSLRFALEDAYAHHVTVIAPSGDSGVTEVSDMAPPYPTYKYRVGTWPATDPLVTAVGGTTLSLSSSGGRLSPDVAWKDAFGASGGGPSAVFSRPQYQDGVAGVVGGHRGSPDISMDGAPSAWGYYSFSGGNGAGWHIFGGSTEAAPMMAGIVALADQLAGHPIGLINPALYKLAERQQAGDQGTGIVSVTSGNNSFGGVTGYQAGPGYNMVTGWGTIDAAKFVPALVRLS